MPDNVTPQPIPTLDQMAQAFGPADPQVLEAMNPPESQEAFREIGTQIASERVLIDMNRILGTAYVFWSKATPQQKKTLKGFSPALLAVAVDRALALEKMRRDFTSAGAADKSARVGSEASAGTAFEKGLTLRDQAEVAFRTVIGTDVSMRKRLTVAVGTAEDLEALAAGLDRLAAFGGELLANPKTAKRTEVAGVDADYVAELATEAASVRAAAKGASGRLTANSTSQGALDTLDGLCIDLLSHIVHAFAAARERDGTIPRLVPQSTRRLLSGRSKPKPKAEDTAAGTPPVA